MILLIDTCTWLKLDLLNEDQVFIPNKLYQWADIEITHQILKEIEYYDCITFQKEETRIVPIENQHIYNEALELNFDEADASILGSGKKTSEYVLISEDGPLLEYARINNFKAFQLIDLFRILFQKNLIESRELYHLTKYLREMKNITKKKEKSILKYRDGNRLE